jgi:hypothetical protein
MMMMMMMRPKPTAGCSANGEEKNKVKTLKK